MYRRLLNFNKKDNDEIFRLRQNKKMSLTSIYLCMNLHISIQLCLTIIYYSRYAFMIKCCIGKRLRRTATEIDDDEEKTIYSTLSDQTIIN